MGSPLSDFVAALDRARPTAPAAPPAPPAAVEPSRAEAPRGERSLDAAIALARWLGQERVRAMVVGGTLLLVGGVFVTDSVWTLPIVLIGAVMVAVGWIGRRLDGRISLEWGRNGVRLGLEAKITPAPAHPRAALPVAATDDDVIEGEAHTVEIDVAELETLIAAAEAVTVRDQRSTQGTNGHALP